MKDGSFNAVLVEAIASEIAKKSVNGKKFIIVSSGAIGFGKQVLGFSKKNSSLVEQQALASVGQHLLMQEFTHCFSKYYQPVAQVLLTQDNFKNDAACSCLSRTIEKLLEMNVVPIVNENDAVSVEELASETHFSDNDVLSALVASHLNAGLLVILTDVDGVFDKNPSENSDAVLVREIKSLKDFGIEAGSSNSGGRGGFRTKLAAVEIALKGQVPIIIAKGEKGNIPKIMRGEETGTIFYV